MPKNWSFECVPPEDGNSAYRFLKPHQIQMIDEALITLGEYGEVRLIVEKGRLRFLVKQTSVDVLKGDLGSQLTRK